MASNPYSFNVLRRLQHSELYPQRLAPPVQPMHVPGIGPNLSPLKPLAPIKMQPLKPIKLKVK